MRCFLIHMRLVEPLLAAGCELRGDARACAIDPRIEPADPADWDTEYLDAVLSVAVVDGLDAALAHIACHASGAHRCHRDRRCCCSRAVPRRRR